MSESSNKKPFTLRGIHLLRWWLIEAAELRRDLSRSWRERRKGIDPEIVLSNRRYYRRNGILAGITIGIGFLVYPVSPWLLIIPSTIFGIGFVVSTLIHDSELPK